MPGRRHLFENVTVLQRPVSVTVASGKAVQVQLSGDVSIRVWTRFKGYTNFLLQHVLYVPGMIHNLVSVARIVDSVVGIIVTSGTCIAS
jgi:hypothetical protein